MTNMVDQTLPEVGNQRDQNDLLFQKNALLLLRQPNTSTVQATLISWGTLERFQQGDWVEWYLIVAAQAEHTLGPAAAPADWRSKMAKFRQDRHGKLPWWMEEIARRNGFEL